VDHFRFILDHRIIGSSNNETLVVRSRIGAKVRWSAGINGFFIIYGRRACATAHVAVGRQQLIKGRARDRDRERERERERERSLFGKLETARRTTEKSQVIYAVRPHKKAATKTCIKTNGNVLRKYDYSVQKINALNIHVI